MTPKEASHQLHALAEQITLRAAELEKLDAFAQPNDVMQTLDDIHDDFTRILIQMNGENLRK